MQIHSAPGRKQVKYKMPQMRKRGNCRKKDKKRKDILRLQQVSRMRLCLVGQAPSWSAGRNRRKMPEVRRPFGYKRKEDKML